MKSIKRSQISNKNKYKSNEIESKKLKTINKKFENAIEQLADYLKQNEQYLNIQKFKDKKKESLSIFKQRNSSKKKINFKNEIFDLDVINYILNKSKKTSNEILIIKVFLSSMNFLSTLKGPFNNDKLLYSLSVYLKIEKRSKDSLIFRFGNKGIKFYVIIKGEVSVLILKEMKVQICFKRYFLHLLLLKMLKEDELVKKSITANAKIKYHFDERDFDSYYEKIDNFVNKYLKEKLDKKKKSIENNQNDMKDRINLKKNSVAYTNNFSFKNNKNFGFLSNKDSDNNNGRITSKRKSAKNYISKNKLSSKFLPLYEEDFVEEEEEESDDKETNYANADLPFFSISDIKEIVHYYINLKEKIETKPKNISVDDYIKNTYIESPFHKPLKNEDFYKKEELLLYKYMEITRKKEGESFGELALQREDNKRTGTIITVTDCMLGILSRSDYRSYLGDIEVKKRRNEINFVMSFAIFHRMNKIVFENRFFNFFTKENFIQGKDIILQDHKINKVFFIMEGQFEIMTNLSLFKIYSLLYEKTKKNMDKEKMKLKFPKEEFNLRLYISYNKDILGLEDCCYEDGDSFITARCLSYNGCAFTIEKSILNEIRHKIPEIDRNINIIKTKREKVMVDRLINIYNRIIQGRNKNKKEKINENEKKQDSFKYINYFFGINQGDRNSNVKKIITRISDHKRVRSAILLSKEKKALQNFNEGETLYNKNQIEENSLNKTRNVDNSKFSGANQKENINLLNEPKIEEVNEFQDNLDSSLKIKMTEVMESFLNKNISNGQNLFRKPSDILNDINNEQNQERSKNLNSNVNKEITQEYSEYSNKVDYKKIIDRRTIQVKNRNNKSLKHKIIVRRNSSEKNFLSFNRKKNRLSMFTRPLSNINRNKMSLRRESNSPRNISKFNSDFDKRSILSRIYSQKSYYNSKDKTRVSSALTPDLVMPVSINMKINTEKFLKKLLGTRYKDQFISYEEQKFNKLIESYDIQENFLKKGKNAKRLKLKLRRGSHNELFKNAKEYRDFDTKLKDIIKIM